MCDEEGAAAVAHVEDLLHFEGGHGLAEGNPADTKAVGQRPLGRESISGFQTGLLDVFDQSLDQLLIELGPGQRSKWIEGVGLHR